jgi:glycosyltransferase involved in cell wall biosynthesis
VRIGLIAPPWVPVPPPAYGGTEAVVDNLARGLQALGHDVHLFTVGESTSPVPREYLYPTAIEPIGDTVAESDHVLAAYDALSGMDVIHDHTTLGPLLAGRRKAGAPPVVATNHGPFSERTQRIYARIAEHASVVAISHSHAASAGSVPITAVIHHGIDLDVYQPGPGDGGYLLFVGRMSPTKGVHNAVRIAKLAGWPLLMATKIREPDEVAYFEQQVRPLLGPEDEIPAEQSLPRRLEMFREAFALLNPIQWREPFGLVMAEAQASGTPVLGFPNGAAPEIVDHGKTGFLGADDGELAVAVDKVAELDRDACRSRIERKFSLERMALDHERLYRHVLTHGVTAAMPAGARAFDGQAGTARNHRRGIAQPLLTGGHK